MVNRDSSRNLASIQTKYTEKSWISQFANRRFLEAIVTNINDLKISNILDAGTGEGIVLDLIKGIRGTQQIFGLDLDRARLIEARSRIRNGYIQSDLNNLPFDDGAFNLVVCLEVLEHVGSPDNALRELHRVTNQYLLASVPNEPWWRLGNMARLKYLKEWGNTPEHINHWSRRGFRNMISRYFRILSVQTPFLWVFILAEKEDLNYTSVIKRDIIQDTSV